MEVVVVGVGVHNYRIAIKGSSLDLPKVDEVGGGGEGGSNERGRRVRVYRIESYRRRH